MELARQSDTKIELRIGLDAWPFPIPLVQDKGQWFFDTAAGREEILNRRIGMNELGAIRVCRAYVEAQREYASQPRNGGEVLDTPAICAAPPTPMTVFTGTPNRGRKPVLSAR